VGWAKHSHKLLQPFATYSFVQYWHEKDGLLKIRLLQLSEMCADSDGDTFEMRCILNLSHLT